jgi:hypothetical protein
MAKVPPQLAFSFGRHSAHLSREHMLRRLRSRAIKTRPNAWLMITH